ncbi:hypothetical protein GGR51DRAFT_559713 [Nemania sp. FL0031]|nr:hypothetical protein GGR51DRAFT_559713 [Nemania sp. FL0031]
MKAWSTLALFVSLSTAATILTPDSVEVRQPYEFGGSLESAPAPVPEDAPAEYGTATATLSEQHTTRALIEVPNELANKVQQVQRREISKKPRGPITAQDFYECATSGTPPRASDCNAVVSNVLATNQALVVASGACLLFQFGTCWGFFCSLCQQLGTDTNFIGSQLSTANTLCVSKGSAGTIVGEAAPQWEAGFIRANGTLPNYAGDVC